MLKLAKNRRSIRKYKNKEVEIEKVNQLINIASIAPSSMNKKPVEFIVVNDRETILKLKNCKKVGTLSLESAPLAFVVIGDTKKSDVWVEDASIVSTFIQLTAESIGLGSCWIQIRNRTSEVERSEVEVREVLNIPENFGVLSIITVGYKYEDKKSYDYDDIDLSKVHYNKY